MLVVWISSEIILVIIIVFMRVNRIFVRDSPNVSEYAYIEEKN